MQIPCKVRLTKPSIGSIEDDNVTKSAETGHNPLINGQSVNQSEKCRSK